MVLEAKVLFRDVCDQKQALHAFSFLPDGCIFYLFFIFESFSNENEYNVFNAYTVIATTLIACNMGRIRHLLKCM